MKTFIIRTYTVGMGGTLRTGGTSLADDFNDAARRLVAGVPVRLAPTGRAFFVDPKTNKEISLHILVYPDDVPNSKIVADALRKARAEERAARAAEREAKDARLSELLDGLDTDEAIRRLST